MIDIKLKENKKHGDSNFPIVIYNCIAKDNFNCLLHWHDEIEIIYVYEGEINFNINLVDYVLKKDDIVIIPPKTLHSITQIKGTYGNWDAFIFDLNMITQINDKCYPKYIAPIINDYYELPLFIQEKGYEEIKSCLFAIAKSYRNMANGYELKIKSEIFNLLYVFYEKELVDTSKRKIKNSVMEKLKLAVDFIQKNYMNDIEVKEIAQSCFLNEFYFMKFFKKNMKTSVNDYLNSYRLEQSINLLLSTEKKITEIASDCGFNSSAYYGKIFKEAYQTTPKAYREQNN